MKKYTVKYDKRFIKELEKIQVQFREKIKIAIDNLKTNPRPNGYIKLKGHEDLYRIRVGDYRIGYEIHDSQLVIILILVAHRKEVYKDL